MPLPSSRNVKLWLALLHELDQAGGAASPEAIYPKLRAHFPEITDAEAEQAMPSGGNQWANRIQWARQHLADRGCLDRAVRGIWRLTPLGKAWLAANWRGAHAEYAAVAPPPLAKGDNQGIPAAPQPATPAPEPEPWPPRRHSTAPLDIGGDAEPVLQMRRARTPTDPAPPPKATTPKPRPSPPLSAVPDPTEQLCRLLEESQRQSGAPRLFEQHLTAAFHALGFAAEHIGGSGETDVFVRAALGPASYSAVLDAKTTRNGRVIDGQINWSVIDAHRQARGATFAAVVGVDFSNGQLQKFADQSKVTLLTTGLLIELLRLHARVPFTLVELRDLFAAPGRADASVRALRERWQQQARHWALIAEIVDTIDKYERSMLGGFAPKVDQLRLLLVTQALNAGQPYTAAPTPQEVEDAVAFLASRAVGVLAEVPGSGGAYQLVVEPRIARQRLTALAQAVAAPPEPSVATAQQRGS